MSGYYEGDLCLSNGCNSGGNNGGWAGGWEAIIGLAIIAALFGGNNRGGLFGGGNGGGDYARGGRRDYGYDYGYGDYGETLSEKEIEHWEKKLMAQLDEREKQMFQKDTIIQKAKAMGKPMEGFGEKELYLASLMVYTDYKATIGQNPDMAIRLAFDWLCDKDAAVKGAEKLAVYHDEIVMGDE